MSQPLLNKKIAAALLRVRKIVSERNAEIIQSSELSRANRELLIKTGWLQEIIKGWYMLVRPDIASGDSAAWYAHFWDFLHYYLGKRFGTEYCLSAESSLELHVDNPLIPRQVIVIVKQGGGTPVHTPYDTSVLAYEDPKKIPMERVIKKNLQIMSLELALCRVSPAYFRQQPQEAEIALRMVKSFSALISQIVENDNKGAAGRLIGAYEFLGDTRMAKEIANSLTILGIKPNCVNPFTILKSFSQRSRSPSPYVFRIQTLWEFAKEQILTLIPKPPAKPKNVNKYIKQVEKIYEHDAYNSLSIEGYRVTHELIEKVKNNQWSPDVDLEDKDTKNALAARGYYEAFQKVKESIHTTLSGADVGVIIQNNLQDWYQALFAPNIRAGIVKQELLFGYRNDRVYIRNSRHVPPPKDAVIDAMETLFECIKNESNKGISAILGHYFFVYIHPYMDGNGRMARFLMNTLLCSAGYNWTVVNMDNRKKYISSIQTADEHRDFKPFTRLILDEMKASQKYLKEL